MIRLGIGSIIWNVTTEQHGVESSAGTALHGLQPDARRHALARFVEEHTSAKLEVMAETFGVSVMTVHRDLDQLTRDGRLERVRGGARAIPRRFAERDVRLRRHMNSGQKDLLARTAAALIPSGAIVCLDDSTTVGAMGQYIADRQPSTVITHSLGLMGVVAQHPSIALVGLGGQYYSETDSFLGTVVVDQVKRIAADLVFVSTTALKNGALFHPDAEAALTKKAIIEVAERKVLLADTSKFESNGLYHVVDLDVFDDIVVAADLPASHRAQLERLGLTIHTAPAL